MNLTAVLQKIAEDLTLDTEISNICNDMWGEGLTVHRRVGELYIPEISEVPLVQILAPNRSRDGNYMIHTITLAIFAGKQAQPKKDIDIVYSVDEEPAERLAERVETVAMQSFGSQGIAAEANQENESTITGPYFIAIYNFSATIRKQIPL